MNVPRKSLFGKLNLSLFRAIESATALAKLRGNHYVELVHWFHQQWQTPGNDLHLLLKHARIDAALLERDMVSALSALPAGASSISDFGDHIELAIERAWTYASLCMDDTKVRGAWLLAAMLQTPELKRALLVISPAFQKLTVPQIADLIALHGAQSVEANEKSHDAMGLPESVPGEASGALKEAGTDKSALGVYCTDLTQQAKEGKIDPVIGREHEIRSMIDILLRRRQNNPLLAGEAGVGKTAVVEGLALAITSGQVPPSLQSVRLLSLDIGALLAGASMRGEFEARLKSVLAEAANSLEPIVMFIDEIHTLVGAGGQAGTGDAANLLKPALARGGLRTVGATTWSEYKRHIEKDPALTRRFQVLQVQEPDEATAIQMVRGLAEVFSKHHGVEVLDEAIQAAVRLSHRYIPARQLPDKAISLLDTACARVAMSIHATPSEIEILQKQSSGLELEEKLIQQEADYGRDKANELQRIVQTKRGIEEALRVQRGQWQQERDLCLQVIDKRKALAAEEDEGKKNLLRAELKSVEQTLVRLQGDKPTQHFHVDEQIMASIVADWTGIPVGRMLGDDVAAVMGLQSQLQERVVGQDWALSIIAERVKTAKAKLSDESKPLGTFLLVGPSGVGKTETALTLASAVYGGEQNLITINMSEYQEAHTISTLKGSPPGYVGYGEGGVLTEAVRRRPYSVILLDEVEKAHPDVHELFYQVFDKGWMEDGEGRVIDFKNTLILLTSNAGSDVLSRLCEDPALMPDQEALAEALQPELRKVFPAAFLGRMRIVPYVPLSADILQNIVRLQLQKVVKRLYAQHSTQLLYTDQAVRHIAEMCGTHEIGARRIGQFIEQHISSELAHLWLQAMHERNQLVSVEMRAQAEEASSAIQGGTVSIRAGLSFHSQSQPAKRHAYA
ncbi:type VI secretion system ATPase TssH [Curvibacter sp. CHRR-16]|uniref:type VI secretion system ATPase TssH n=1 Tax=Curvibacter sp. CHRR-16 TaxID=2835872 RepID=UPI001BD92934|nr:type VI secretion system ATPase TssH [Curvibacter sp. CHRR-16]MBT0571820.1 type VI secretion system ATPase TssH [Curvibacter sp. CHRR-16]